MAKWFKSKEIYEFGDFRLDPAAPALWHSREMVSLTPKVLQTLLILIENHDSVVSKEAFHEKLWPGIFIEENALPQNIYLLRKALKEKEPDREYVENVARRGYRFRGSVRHSRRGRGRLLALVATLVLSALGSALAWKSRPANDRGTDNQEAYELYLLGRTIWTKRDSARMDQAFNYLRRAVDKDPNFALAWAALADFHALERAPALEARQAAEWALELNANLAEPHATLGFVSMVHDWDWPAAERHFRRSIELNPRYPMARQWFALYFALSRRFKEAEAQLQEGLRIEPLSINLLHGRCHTLYLSRQYASAASECSKVLAIEPVFPFARASLMRIHARMGDYGWMLDHLGGDLSGADYKAPADSLARKAFRAEGPGGYWRTLVEEVRASARNFFGLAGFYMELGDAEAALRSLGRAVDAHEFMLIFGCADPLFDPLRGDPRFDAVMAKVCGSQTR